MSENQVKGYTYGTTHGYTDVWDDSTSSYIKEGLKNVVDFFYILKLCHYLTQNKDNLQIVWTHSIAVYLTLNRYLINQVNKQCITYLLSNTGLDWFMVFNVTLNNDGPFIYGKMEQLRLI